MSGGLQEYRPVFITVHYDSGVPDANINLPSSLLLSVMRTLKRNNFVQTMVRIQNEEFFLLFCEVPTTECPQAGMSPRNRILIKFTGCNASKAQS